MNVEVCRSVLCSNFSDEYKRTSKDIPERIEQETPFFQAFLQFTLRQDERHQMRKNSFKNLGNGLFATGCSFAGNC